MNHQDYLDWKRHPLTMSMFDALHNNISALCTELGSSAGVDPLEDRFKAGYILACRDVLEQQFEEIETND